MKFELKIIPFFSLEGIREHIRSVLYERKRMVQLGHCYEVCVTNPLL